jgi:hypothetical protein
MPKSKCQVADGDRFDIQSTEYLHWTFGLWHWDLNAMVPLRVLRSLHGDKKTFGDFITD